MPEQPTKKSILAQNNTSQGIAAKYAKADDFFFLGRGYTFPIALEGALKLKEISYIHAEGYSAAEIETRPDRALIDDEDAVRFLLVPQDSMYDKTMANLAMIRARKGPIIALATEGDMAIKKVANDVIYLPRASPNPFIRFWRPCRCNYSPITSPWPKRLRMCGPSHAIWPRA